MSIAGSVSSAQGAGSALERPAQSGPSGTTGPNTGDVARRVRIVRWEGLIPVAIGLGGLLVGWFLFGGRVVESTVEEAGSKALGAAVDIDRVSVEERNAAVELIGVSVADPFDRHRNLVQAGALRIELEPEPLLERKLIIRRLSVRDVTFGTTRATPARTVSGDGFAPRMLAELDRWSKQFKVPLLTLTPIDTIRSIALDPTQLETVKRTLAVSRQVDSVRRIIEQGYSALRLRETLDSSAALGARLRGTNIRALGVAGLRTAIADARVAIARVDSTRRRVDALERSARSGIDLLQSGVRSLDDARRADYEFARGLLALPRFDSPEIGAALFGPVTIDKVERAVYWTSLARQYAPPGLLPRESAGPQRLRRAGTTIRFVRREAHPTFLLRRADLEFRIAGGLARGSYAVAVADATTEPAIVGRPMRFALRRDGRGAGVGSLRALGAFDHTGSRPRSTLSVHASDVRLPTFPIPVLPLRAEPGEGASSLAFALDGDHLSARWTVRSDNVAWPGDSARARSLNQVESLVARVIGGIRTLDLTAEMDGPIRAPGLAVRSNIDRVISARLREVAGEELQRAVAKVRASVDRIVDEKTAPLRAGVDSLRGDVERRMAEARAKLDGERKKLEELAKGRL